MLRGARSPIVPSGQRISTSTARESGCKTPRLGPTYFTSATRMVTARYGASVYLRLEVILSRVRKLSTYLFLIGFCCTLLLPPRVPLSKSLHPGNGQKSSSSASRGDRNFMEMTRSKYASRRTISGRHLYIKRLYLQQIDR